MGLRATIRHTRWPLALVAGLVSLACWAVPAAEPLDPPPQDRGLPYTRSARAAALAKIREHVAVFAGSRYAYVKGFKVRLDERAWRAEAARRGETVVVPASFAGALDLRAFSPEPAPAYLADRWVYELKLPPREGEVDLAEAARQRGLRVFEHPRGLVLAGEKEVTFSEAEGTLLESVITLFDTPETFADPEIATRYIPTLARQGMWTDHARATPEQLASLNGPATIWESAPREAHDLTGFHHALLGSAVPPPGVYPRLLFSPEDVPAVAARVRANSLGRRSLLEMAVLLEKTWWNPESSDGQLFAKLASGDLAGLAWAECAPGTPPSNIPHTFKGQKPGIRHSHVAYVPECLTAMAFYCLLTGDEARGRQAAAAVANYYRLREPLIDEWNAISDSEFGSAYVRPDGTRCRLEGNGGATHWRGMHGLVAHMNLGLALDFAGTWMTVDEKELMRRVIAKATYGRRAYGQDGPARFRDVNWAGWDLPHFLAVAAIEGLEGFDREAYASNVETVRAFCDWGVDPAGVVFESNGKSPGSMQFVALSLVALARRGENLWGHPHWRRLLEGQIQMTSPSGRVTVNSGTQYAPHSRQPLSFSLVDTFKAFFPSDRKADYLLSQATVHLALGDESMRLWLPEGSDGAGDRAALARQPHLRLPSPSYPGFVRGVLYDADYAPATRADLDLPLDFDAPVHGVFSSFSDRTTNAVWMNMMVRPNHYLGAGHHHADAGMIHFSALGVDWFAESSFSQCYDGAYHNLVLVNGLSQPTNLPGFANAYQAAATYLGATTAAGGGFAAADLTASYSYRWLTQPAQSWPDSTRALGWEMDPSEEVRRLFAGTARMKLRFWWPSYTYCNFIPTCRAPFNPMRHVFRTVGLVRGPHPYGLVLDDLRKDDQPRLYQWTAMLNANVRRATLPGTRPGERVLQHAPDAAPARPDAGAPLLLVRCLGAVDALEVETLDGPPDRKGQAQPYARLTTSVRGDEARFRLALLPFRMGEPLPQARDGTLAWPGQTDRLAFTVGPDGRTRCTVTHDGKRIAGTEAGEEKEREL